MALLLPARVNDGLEVGSEVVAACTLTAKRGLSPEDEAAKFLLSMVVGRLDAVVGGEAPERILVLEDVKTGAAHDGKAAGSAEHQLDRGNQT